MIGSAAPPSLVQTESGGNWAARNDEVGSGGARGHFGRVQFGRARFAEAKAAGAVPQGMTIEEFASDTPEGRAAQVSAENWHFTDLQSRLGYLVGRVVNGVPMTMGALVALGHLGGAGGARKFVETNGKYNPSDSFGTSLSDYARTHGDKAIPTNSGGADAGRAANRPVDRNPARLAWLRRTGQMDPRDEEIYDRGVAAGRIPPPQERRVSGADVYRAAANRPRVPLPPVDLSAGMVQIPKRSGLRG